MCKRVNVLVSTYNGEKYITEQIDSILEQSYNNIYIYIRDDGSTDNTRTILREYEKYDNVQILEGDNIGYGPSFLSLLAMTDEGDYWAFCDQDDIWLPDKINLAVNWLKQQDASIPCLYHGSYYNTDENLENRVLVKQPDYKYDFVRAITECIHLGFSEVMNGTLRQLVLRGNPDYLVTHDWWTELVAMKFGRVYYDAAAMTLHRRLESSISVNSMAARFAWLKRAWSGNAEIHSCTLEFERVFGKDMKDRESKINRWFCYDKYDFVKAIKKCFYWHRWRPTWSSEFVIRMLMLMGKI